MWIKISTWIVSNFSWIKKWFTPNKIIFIIGTIIVILILYLGVSSWSYSKKIESLKEENIAVLRQQIEILESLNIHYEKTLKKQTLQYNKSLEAIKKLHFNNIKRERTYAKIKENTKNDEDRNISDILRYTFDELRKTAYADKNSTGPKIDTK